MERGGSGGSGVGAGEHFMERGGLGRSSVDVRVGGTFNGEEV